MHESFDDELKERLRHYTEEPDRNLWEGIAPHVVSVRPEPEWIVWSQRTSAVLIGAAMMIAVVQSSKENAGENKSFGMAEQQRGSLNNQVIQENDKNIAIQLMKDNETTPKNITRVKSISKENPVNAKTDITSSDFIVSKEEESTLIVLTEKFMEQESNENLHIEPIGEYNLNKDTIKVISEEDESDTLKNTEQQKKEYKRKNQRHRKYTLYFTAMPTFGYQRIESNQEDNIIIESIERVSAFSTKRLGVRAELGAEFPLTKRLKLFSGLLYYQRKQTIDYTEKQLDSTIITSGPNGEVIIEPEFSYVGKSVEYELKNIGLQVGVIYKLSRDKQRPLSEKEALTSTTMQPRKKFLHSLGTGLEFHKALNKTSEFNMANGFTDPSAYVFFNVYYRLQYPNEGKLRAIFQPTLNYSFYINENLNAPFYVKPFGLGLNFGCTYNF